MFGNNNAGIGEVFARFGRRTAKPNAVASESRTFSGSPLKALDVSALRETYFALQPPVRWLR